MKPRVIVVGGGWAGISCAVELLDAGFRVVLLEAAPQLGGRARSIPFAEQLVENGQHLLLGAYRECLRMMQRIGVDTESMFQRQPMQLHLLRPGTGELTLQLPAWLPAPLHLLWGILGLKGVTLADRLQALGFALRMRLRGFALKEDQTLLGFLQQQGQSEVLIQGLWEPICLATLNTPVKEASTQLFLNVLRDSFSLRRQDSDLLLPRSDLGSLLPGPALHYLRGKGAEVRLGQRARKLLLEDGTLCGVIAGEEKIRGDRVVLATPPAATTRLLQSSRLLPELIHGLEGLGSYPICTVYLRYPRPLSLPYPLMGLLDSTTQWILERAHCGQPELLAAIISGPGPHEAMEQNALAEMVSREIATRLPQLSPPLEYRVIREKRATFRATAGVSWLRPNHSTDLAGLWLAGDHIAGPYPATLEGAVRSGVQCARQIIGADQQRPEDS